jgi:hypothetical protein
LVAALVQPLSASSPMCSVGDYQCGRLRLRMQLAYMQKGINEDDANRLDL